MEGRRGSRLVASAVRPHPALAVHLARGQVGQGVGPVLDASYDFTEVFDGCYFFISSVAFLHQGLDMLGLCFAHWHQPAILLNKFIV
jgi:hypothetical protein